MTPTQYAQHQKDNRKVTTDYAASLKPHGLTPMEASALAYANMRTMTELANELGVTLPQITALTKKLMERKLISYVYRKEDRRSKFMTLTKRGFYLLEQLEAGNE